jgi:hypothetical protein
VLSYQYKFVAQGQIGTESWIKLQKKIKAEGDSKIGK